VGVFPHVTELIKPKGQMFFLSFGDKLDNQTYGVDPTNSNPVVHHYWRGLSSGRNPNDFFSVATAELRGYSSCA